MTNIPKVVQRYKEAKDAPPSQLLALVKRSLSGTPTYKFYPASPEEPHLFTVPSNERFSINMTDMKILLCNGLTRIQVNDPGKITLYFGPQGGEEAPAPPTERPRRDLHQLDFFGMGQRAFKNGLPRVPSSDPNLMRALRGLPDGNGSKVSAMTEWGRGWDRANLDAPVPE